MIWLIGFLVGWLAVFFLAASSVAFMEDLVEGAMFSAAVSAVVTAVLWALHHIVLAVVQYVS
jgi:hypothetical protein